MSFMLTVRVQAHDETIWHIDEHTDHLLILLIQTETGSRMSKKGASSPNFALLGKSAADEWNLWMSASKTSYWLVTPEQTWRGCACPTSVSCYATAGRLISDVIQGYCLFKNWTVSVWTHSRSDTKDFLRTQICCGQSLSVPPSLKHPPRTTDLQ